LLHQDAGEVLFRVVRVAGNIGMHGLFL